jgi:hypothetical protein
MKTMKVIFLQILVLLCAIGAVAGIKLLGLTAWLTYPLLAVVVALAILGLAAVHYERPTA